MYAWHRRSRRTTARVHPARTRGNPYSWAARTVSTRWWPACRCAVHTVRSPPSVRPVHRDRGAAKAGVLSHTTRAAPARPSSSASTASGVTTTTCTSSTSASAAASGARHRDRRTHRSRPRASAPRAGRRTGRRRAGNRSAGGTNAGSTSARSLGGSDRLRRAASSSPRSIRS